MAGGIRGIRAVASESWDDDFLWQHSSCDDLHLPSASHGLSSSTRSNRPLATRTSTKTSSRSSVSMSSSSNDMDAAAAGQLTETSIRPNKGSSTASYASTQSSSWGYPSQLSLHDSSPELEYGMSGNMGRAFDHFQDNHEADEEEEDPTITLTHARLYGAHSSSSPSKKGKRMSTPIASAAAPSAGSTSSLLYAPPGTGISPPSAPSPSLASWRSPTPSLTLSDIGQFNSRSMMLESDDDDDGGAVTETDNETEMEIDTGHSSAAAVASGSTPRYSNFAATLFGGTGSAAAPMGVGYEGKASPVLPRPERKKRGTISFQNPFSGNAGLGRKTSASSRSGSKSGGNGSPGVAIAGHNDQGDNGHKRDLPATTTQTAKEASYTGQKKHHRRSSSRALAFARLPFSRSTSSSTSTSTSTSVSTSTSAALSISSPYHPPEDYGSSPPTSYNYLSASAQSSTSHYSRHRQLHFHTQDEDEVLGRSTPTTIVDLRDEIYRNRTLRSRNNTADGVMSLSDPRQRGGGQETIPNSPPGIREIPYAQSSVVSLASTMGSGTRSFPLGNDVPKSSSGTSRRPTRKLTKRQEPLAGPSSSRSNTIRRIVSPLIPADGLASRTYAAHDHGQLRADSSVDDFPDLSFEGPSSPQAYQTTSNQSFSRFKLFRSGSSSSAGGSNQNITSHARSRKSSTSTNTTSRRAVQSGAAIASSGDRRPPSSGREASHTALIGAAGANVKTSAIPFPSPERKPSKMALRRIQSVDPDLSHGRPAEGEEEAEEGINLHDNNDDTVKKPKRPLSLTGMLLSRSTSTSTAPTMAAREPRSQLQNRTRSGTVMAAPHSAHPAMQSFYHASSAATTTTSPLGPTFSFGANNGTLVGRTGTQEQTLKGGRRYLHRSTMSSGSVPTAKALQAGVLDRRLSVDFSVRSSPSNGKADGQQPPKRGPPVQPRRSFTPLFKSTTALPNTIAERPISTLSLLSDTSTVRPPPQPQPEPPDQSGTPTLRRRHLPSLSLTLLPGSSASLGAATSTPPVPRAYTADLPIAGPAASSSPSGYFASSLAPSAQTLAASPGGRSTTSSSSNGSASGLVRRVSLTDLRIPPRISSAQAKIGQDLQRVKEFKDGVEELKRLRKIYRTLVAVEDASDTSLFSHDESTVEPAVSVAREDGDTSTMLSIPVEATAKVDHIFTRVALDYRQWWEIADVLINLADGAEVVETEDIPRNAASDSSAASPSPSPSLGRARCISEMPARTGSSSPTPAPRLSNSSIERDIGIATSSPTRESRQDTPAQTGVRKSFASDEGVDVSTPTSPISATLAPSPSAVRRSPPVLVRSQSTSVFPSRSEALASEVADAGILVIGPVNEARRFGSPRSQSLNASERQLEILRSMLKNSSTCPRDASAPLSAAGGGRTGYLASVAEKSAPSSPVPSRLTAKPYLTPEKRLPTSFSLPAGLGSTTPTSTPLSAAETAISHSDSSSSLGTPIARQRQESGKSKTDTASSSEGGRGGKRSKNRLREVSRAGMQGIRDFLKALTKSGASLTLVEPALASSPSIRFADLPTAAAAKRAEGRTPVRPDLSMTRRVVSDSPIGSIRHSCGQHVGVGHQHTPIRGNLLSAALMASDTKGSPLSSASRTGSGSSSDEEEDWDRHSSEDDDEQEDDEPHGKDGGGQLLRSDTQATILASSSSAPRNAAGLPEIASRGHSAFVSDRRRKSDGPATAGTGSGRVATSTATTTTLRLPADSWQQGTKLVMTTEAMPTLLAKIDEVKLHCASCVTELRNVTV